MWKNIAPYILQHGHLVTTDSATFAREYMPRQGYNAGETNQLINNFKKDIAKKNTPQWYYREQAVLKFATEFSLMIDNTRTEPILVTAIPSSKIQSDPLYDNRFEDMFAYLTQLSRRVQTCWPVVASASVQSSHSGGSRSPTQIMSNYRWQGFGEVTPQRIVVFDDILTTGSHFRAYVDFCRNNNYTGEILGVFWARCI